MTNLGWLAAILAPRDTLPHPNFRVVSVDATATLSAVVNAHSDRLPRETARDPEASFNSDERLLLDLSRRALSYGEAHDAAIELLRNVERLASHDVAMGVAALLVSSVSLSERDDYRSFLDVLKAVRQQLTVPSPDQSLLAAMLALQESMRLVEVDQSGREEAETALGLLDSLDVTQLPSFPVSDGVSWNSAHTLTRIIDEARYVAQLNLSGISFEGVSRALDLVRQELPDLLHEAVGSGWRGAESHVHEEFEKRTLSSARTWRAMDPVDLPTWRSLFHFEVTGNLSLARGWRRLLGELRLLRPNDEDELTHKTEGLQLLRHARDARSYSNALRYIRANGPLASLRWEVESILKYRLAPELLLENELRCLEAAAHLLKREEADAALEVMVAALTSPLPSRSTQHRGARADLVLKAAVELAKVAGRSGHLLSQLADSVPRRGDDYLTEQAYARAISGLDWTGVDVNAADRWRAVLESRSADHGGEVDLVGDALRAALEMAVEGPEGRIDAIAETLNLVIRGRQDPSKLGNVNVMVDTIRRNLEEIQNAAHSGMYAVNAVAAADVGLGLAIYCEADSLWSPVVDLLLDPAVSRRDKSPALERLANQADKVPTEVRNRLSSGVTRLIESGGEPMVEASIVPYPEAVRAAAGLQLLDEQRFMTEVCRLTSSSDVRARIEGARCIVVAARSFRPAPDYLSTLALQLTYDSDANVRSHAARALPFIEAEALEPYIVERLRVLLLADGVIGPLLTLRALSESRAIVPSELLPDIEELAESHIAYGVRLQAREVLRSQAHAPSL